MPKTFLCILILLFVFQVKGQEMNPSLHFQNDKATNCEENTFLLDLIVNQFLDKEFADDKIIVISKIGKKESSGKNLHKRRLFTIKTYLDNKTRGQLKIVTATGDPSNSLGRIEIYIKGKLAIIIVSLSCEDIPIAVCDDKDADPKYYLSGKLKRKCK